MDKKLLKAIKANNEANYRALKNSQILLNIYKNSFSDNPIIRALARKQFEIYKHNKLINQLKEGR